MKAARADKSAPQAGAPAIDVEWVASKLMSRDKPGKVLGDMPLAVAIAIGLALLVVVAGVAWISWMVLSGSGPSSQADPSASAGSSAPPPTSSSSAAAPAAVTNALSAQPSLLTPPDTTQALTPEQIMAAEKTAAEGMLKASLPESRGLTYRGVRTFVKGPIETTPVVFCGEFDSLNPAGGHVGYQHFISSTDSAQVETMTTPGQFNQAWQDLCSGSPGPPIWK